MSQLNITQTTLGENQFRVELSGDFSNLRPQVTFDYRLGDDDARDLRWYMESYLENPHEPAPQIAARVEQRMVELGNELFDKIFDGNKDAQRFWAKLPEDLHRLRVEVSTSVQEAATIPWELLRDPHLDVPLALRAQAFVRSHPQAKMEALTLSDTEEEIRILLVICRPGGKDDVPFRSVASRLVKGLVQNAQAQLDVLRPPTFEQLGRVLRQAKNTGKAYHIVHFDGHGMYEDAKLVAASSEFSRIKLDAGRTGKHGYLAFENARLSSNMQPVDGKSLGDLLVETQVPVLVLNACRSAHTEAPETPQDEDGNPHEQIRAFGSLAQEVMDCGVAGVVAMRYNVYVKTAAQFVADLYAALATGQALGEAVSYGRKQLHAQPLREITRQPLPLQDWLVPVVYEAAALRLFTPSANTLAFRLDGDDGANQRLVNVPARPDVGFIGRDETLLALDRAFDAQSIVLLHAYAGSGKTATAAEFARWYVDTGAAVAVVIFSSFERPRGLAAVLEDLGKVFEQTLAQSGIQWLALEAADRREIALQVLRQIPVLWIWDNVEEVMGLEGQDASGFAPALGDFLRAARETQARFLLTSRRDERAWLGELPCRIAVPSMPMLESELLAKEIAAKRGVRHLPFGAWRPLLRFAQGNPLTLTVLVGQALHMKLRDTEIANFIEKLQSGEQELIDEDESLGRSRSLTASLNYGFDHAFSTEEREVLGLLGLFQGWVDMYALEMMGNLKRLDGTADYSLPQLQGWDNDKINALLQRAADLGLLTAHGGGFFSIHPALPWFFQRLAQRSTAEKTAAQRAFVESLGELSNYYHDQYIDGNSAVIANLSAEEANLLHARRLARQQGWWHRVTSTMQGLYVLYDHTGRRGDWQRLLEEIVPDFVNPADDGPLAGREAQWSFVTQWRVLLAQAQRDLATAARLQQAQVEWNRQQAAPYLPDHAAASEVMPDVPEAGRNVVRSLAVSLEQLGNIQREQDKADCAQTYQEAIPLCQHIGDKQEEAICAFNLGRAYTELPALRDLAQAQQWYQRSLEMSSEADNLGRSKCLITLGIVKYEQFQESRAAQATEAVLLAHLNAALNYYQQALKLLPADAVDAQAIAHNQLGNIYDDGGDLARALHHWRESIRYFEAAGNLYHAGVARFNIAQALANADKTKTDDALLYAQTALKNFQHYGAGAADKIEETEKLIAEIQQLN